jgi:hypothetical protein
MRADIRMLWINCYPQQHLYLYKISLTSITIKVYWLLTECKKPVLGVSIPQELPPPIMMPAMLANPIRAFRNPWVKAKRRKVDGRE